VQLIVLRLQTIVKNQNTLKKGYSAQVVFLG